MKDRICNAIRAYINQRPGFDPHNYGDAASYRSDLRRAQQQRRDALAILASIEARDGITADALLAPQSGRFKVAMQPDGALRLDYCTGQYWPTEFRAGVARYLASVLWDYWRDHSPSIDGDGLRRNARLTFGRGLAGRYFN